jgi:pilus assembly protein Flp/PilA
MNDKLIAAWVWLQHRGEEGATAVEYGMLVALIAAVIVATVALLGGDVNDAFDKVEKALP